jgi:WD40 repeat protein
LTDYKRVLGTFEFPTVAAMTAKSLCWCLATVAPFMWATEGCAQNAKKVNADLDPAPAAAKLRWTVPDIGYPEGFSADGLAHFTVKNEDDAAFLVVWDLRTGKRIRAHKLPFARVQPGVGANIAAGRFFVCADQAKLLAIDLKTGEEWNLPLDPKDLTRSVTISPRGDYICHQSGFARSVLVETRTGKVAHRTGDKEPSEKVTVLEMLDAVKFTPDGQYVHFIGREFTGSVLHIWDVAARKIVLTIRHHLGKPLLSPDAKSLVVPTGEPTKTRQEFLDRQINKGEPGKLAIWSLDDLKLKTLIPWSDLELFVNRFEFQFSPNGRIAALWLKKLPENDTNSLVQFWDIAAGKLLWATEVSRCPFQGEFSADGKHFAVYTLQKPILHMLDVAAQRHLWKSEPLRNDVPIYFTSDSKHLILPVLNGVKHFEVVSGKESKSLKTARYAADIRSTTDGRYLIFEDFLKPTAKPARPKEPDGKKLIRLWRVIHRDTGREVYRSEYPEYHRFHVPGHESTLIQIVTRKGFDIFDMSCWELPKRQP